MICAARCGYFSSKRHNCQATKQQALSAILFLLLYSCSQHVIAQPALSPTESTSSNTLQDGNASQIMTSALQPAAAPGPALSGPGPTLAADLNREQFILDQLGGQQAYSQQGYPLNTTWPHDSSLDTWQSLGCLTSVTNLTLRGSVPPLPASWANNGSFPFLQSLDLSQAQLQGTLPDGWGSPKAFPKLRTLNLTNTQLSGSLPATWGSSGAFPALVDLQLGATSIDISQLEGSLPPEWGARTAFPLLKTLQINYCNTTGGVPCYASSERLR